MMMVLCSERSGGKCRIVGFRAIQYPRHLSPDRLKTEVLSQYDKDVMFRINEFEDAPGRIVNQFVIVNHRAWEEITSVVP